MADIASFGGVSGSANAYVSRGVSEYIKTVRESQRLGVTTSAAAGEVSRGDDEVEVSDVARYLNILRGNPIREELVNRVKEEIAIGAYETPEKIESAIGELAKDM